MECAQAPNWLTLCVLIVGSLCCIGAALIVVAGVFRGAFLLFRGLGVDFMAWADLRQAVDEWLERNPERAARYKDSRQLWRTW